MMELGATVCTPRGPACLTCPVIELCATRGEMTGGAKAAPQRKREIHFALDQRDGAVFLVQRGRDASLMAGMWELPEVVSRAREKQVPPLRFAQGRNVKGKLRDSELVFTVRHSITVTDYTVRVWSQAAPPGTRGEWVAMERLPKVALTGLARKILRKAEILGASGS
jgi:A/G-specific adenine glycosylase